MLLGVAACAAAWPVPPGLRRPARPSRPGSSTRGNVAFLIAVRGGSLVVVAVITALYPGGTVLLARRFLGERLTRRQLAGLAAAAAAVSVLAVS